MYASFTAEEKMNSLILVKTKLQGCTLRPERKDVPQKLVHRTSYLSFEF